MSRVVVILGATATGKSALAVRLAERADGEIVNADAIQFYRGFDIGTAKPSAAERARVPHHLFDLLAPAEHFSAGEFARLAGKVIDEIEARGSVPILVGGSGFYLRALLSGLPEIPAVAPEIRQQLRRRLEEQGVRALHAELELKDSALAARVAPGDSQRVLRGLEVWESTGRPLSSWQQESPARSPPKALRIGLRVPRDRLRRRIKVRIESMVEAGWVEEVRALLESTSVSAPAFQAIGYREIARHALGERTLEQAMTEAERSTRRYAKRQETWFRREPDVAWIDSREADERLPAILGRLRCFFLGGS